MRASAVVLALAASATARNILRTEGQSLARRDELDVPGQNPLKFCEANRGDDTLSIDEVILTPNPPEAGQTLLIEATGTVYEKIEQGAYVNLEVKYGYIRLINTQADLCNEIKNVDLECPIEKGPISITKQVDLPKEIPPGKYTVQADVFTKDGEEHITCLTATVTFGKKTILGEMLDL